MHWDTPQRAGHPPGSCRYEEQEEVGGNKEDGAQSRAGRMMGKWKEVGNAGRDCLPVVWFTA